MPVIANNTSYLSEECGVISKIRISLLEDDNHNAIDLDLNTFPTD